MNDSFEQLAKGLVRAVRHAPLQVIITLISFVGRHCKNANAAFLISLGMVAGPMGKATATLPPGNTVEQWNTIAENTVVGSGAFQNEGLIYMAYVAAPVYDAAVSIEGGYEPYGSAILAAPGASTEAAVIEAAYQTLLNYFPPQAGTLR